MTTSGPDDVTTQSPAPRKSRLRQNIAAVLLLLLTAAALWKFWPRGPQPTPNPFEGRLEQVTRDRIVGWAWERARPDAPVKVEITDGFNPPAIVTADKYRADLVKAGKGNGRHSFILETGDRFEYARTYVVHVKIVGAATELHNSPQTFVVGTKWIDDLTTSPTTRPAAPTTAK